MNKFFLTGPNRTGTTLLARCIDDHPKCICLFETNVHIKMFGGKGTVSHGGRMRKAHGFNSSQIEELLQKSNGSILQWYDHCGEFLKTFYEKPDLTHIGDKNPFFHEHPVARKEIAAFPNIWTIRDPRAVWHSRHRTHKGEGLFFQRYLDNVRYFMKRLDTSLVIRFEDLLLEPEQTMREVYDFLGVEYDDTFLDRSGKPHDRRFRWNPNAVDSFDKSKINAWKSKKLPRDFFTPLVKKIMHKFHYE